MENQVIPDYHEDTLALHGCLSAELLSQGETWSVEKKLSFLLVEIFQKRSKQKKLSPELTNQTNNYIQAKEEQNSGLRAERWKLADVVIEGERRSTTRYSIQFVPTILYLLRRRMND